MGDRAMTNSRRRRSACACSAVALALVLVLGAASLGAPVQGQQPESPWSAPVNLSASGAASQPFIAAHAGALQVFWWDQFEGLTMSTLSAGAWSPPRFVPIPALPKEKDPQDKPGTAAMPTLVTDAAGTVHALWVGPADQDTELEPLLHSSVAIGASDWLTPTVVAESASVFEVSAAPDGAVLVAYVRPSDTPERPAGYYVQALSPDAGWGTAALVSATRYARLLTPEETVLRVLQSNDGGRHLVWEDPRTGRATYAHTSGGIWTSPEPLALPEDYARAPRLASLANGALLRLYEAGPTGFCRLLLQRSPALDSPASKLPGFTWGAPQRVLAELQRCPGGAERFWTAQSQLLWMWGLDTGQLTVAGYDATGSQAAGDGWSTPRALDLKLRNPEDASWLYWSQLDAQVQGDSLHIAGIDAAGGDVWFASSVLSALDIAFGATSPWSAPAMPAEGADGSAPAIAVDPTGDIHMVWLQAAADTGETTLLYANVSRGSRAIAVSTVPADELLRQPCLLADEAGLLHLAWSGENAGQIVYARARVAEAGSAGWSEPRVVSAEAPSAAWPQLAADAVGRLYLLYVIPTNEGRGVYLARSLDGGATWSMPTNVFDAWGYGWVGVDRPTLAVSPNGQVHLAWVNVGVAANQGIYYAQAEWAEREGLADGGFFIWNEPRQMTEPGYDWPRLALIGDRLHLVYAGLSDGALWQAAGDVADIYTGTYFETASRLSGWDAIALPYGLTEVGGVLHLVGVDPVGELLYHSALEPAAGGAGRWSEPEKLVLGPGYVGGGSAQADAPREGGVLAVALNVLAGESRAESFPAVLSVARALPTVDPALLATPVLAPSATPTPGETATPMPEPVATFDLSGPDTPERGVTTRSLVMGAGLGALVVALAAWLRHRWRSR